MILKIKGEYKNGERISGLLEWYWKHRNHG
jgi:hypothetical protein